MPRRNVCRPPPGQVYLTIGQDLFAIQDYLTVQYNASLHEYMHNNNNHNNGSATPPPLRTGTWPAAFMAYSDLATLAGLDTPTDYGSGVEYANGLVSANDPTTTTTSPVVGLQLGLWLGGSDGCRAVVNGTWDARVRSLVDDYLATSSPFVRVFVRLGYEFDNPSFGYGDDPAAYRGAFRVIVDACRQRPACRDRTLWTWHSWAAGLMGDLTLDDFYPGDEYVDWMGVSVFQQFSEHHHHHHDDNDIWSGGSMATLTSVLEYAVAHDKPVMIAESTPFGGIDQQLMDAWGQWFRPVLVELLDAYPDTIAMWSYIDCDWDAQPMWHNVGFGDTRVAKNATILRRWRQDVLSRTLGYGALATYCAQDDDRNHQHDDDVGTTVRMASMMDTSALATFSPASWFPVAASLFLGGCMLLLLLSVRRRIIPRAQPPRSATTFTEYLQSYQRDT